MGNNWNQQSTSRKPGAFTAQAKRAGESVQLFASDVMSNKDKYTERTQKRAAMARTLAKMSKDD